MSKCRGCGDIGTDIEVPGLGPMHFWCEIKRLRGLLREARGGERRLKYAWAKYVASADFHDDLGSDPYDLSDGEIVVNIKREVRIVLSSYRGGEIGKYGIRWLWLDPETGVVHDHPQKAWGEWAGEQLWVLSNKDGEGWHYRSPFANHVEHMK